MCESWLDEPEALVGDFKDHEFPDFFFYVSAVTY